MTQERHILFIMGRQKSTGIKKRLRKNPARSMNERQQSTARSKRSKIAPSVKEAVKKKRGRKALRLRKAFSSDREWTKYFMKVAKSGMRIIHRDESVGKFIKKTGDSTFKVRWECGTKAEETFTATSYCTPSQCEFMRAIEKDAGREDMNSNSSSEELDRNIESKTVKGRVKKSKKSKKSKENSSTAKNSGKTKRKSLSPEPKRFTTRAPPSTPTTKVAGKKRRKAATSTNEEKKMLPKLTAPTPTKQMESRFRNGEEEEEREEEEEIEEQSEQEEGDEDDDDEDDTRLAEIVELTIGGGGRKKKNVSRRAMEVEMKGDYGTAPHEKEVDKELEENIKNDEEEFLLKSDDIWLEMDKDPRHAATTHRHGFYLVGNPLSKNPRGFYRFSRKSSEEERKCAVGMLDDGFSQIYDGESDEKVRARSDMYKATTREVSTIVEGIIKDSQAEVFTKLKGWIQSRYADERSLAAVERELPTAVVVSGFNTADHAKTMRSLRAYLTSGVGGVRRSDLVTANDSSSSSSSNSSTSSTHEDDNLKKKKAAANNWLFVAGLSPSRAANRLAAMAEIVRQLLRQGHAEKKRIVTRRRNSLQRMHQLDKKFLTKKAKADPIKALKEWYEELSDEIRFLSPDAAGSKTPRKIAVVIEDIERMNAEVLDYVIYILCKHTIGLPIVIVAATATGVLQLSPQNLGSLWRERFTLPRPREIFDEMFDILFFENACPVHLPFETMRFLQRDFLERTASISGFGQALSAVLLSHFDSQGLSQLSSSSSSSHNYHRVSYRKDNNEDDEERQNKCRGASRKKKKRSSRRSSEEEEEEEDTSVFPLNDADILYLQSLPSVKAQKLPRNTCKKKFVSKVDAWLQNFRRHRDRLPTAFRLVWSVYLQYVLKGDKKESRDTQKKRQQFYHQIQSSTASSIPSLDRMYAAVMGLPEAALAKTLESWVKFFNHHCQVFSEEYQGLKESLKGMLDDIRRLESGEDKKTHLELMRKAASSATTTRKRIKNPKKRRSALLQAPTYFVLHLVLFMASLAKSTKETRQSINRKAVSFLREICEGMLTPLHSLPLYEIFTFRAQCQEIGVGAAEVGGWPGFRFDTHMLDLRPQRAIHRGLARPHGYLESEQGGGNVKRRRKSDDNVLTSEMEDVCISHGILMEMGQSVNLADWYKAFAVVHGQKFSTKELQARFMQASSELQYMGLIKPSSRKIDHVQQLSSYRPTL
eukprot:jgi/Bigna1/72933/fgenesh1_pg.22_\